jgi:hypothetical protein
MKAGREYCLRYPVIVIALMPAVATGCAKAEGLRPLTAKAVERARVVCRAPTAQMHSDGHHVSLVLEESPDYKRQLHCLREELRDDYWYDQTIVERPEANS